MMVYSNLFQKTEKIYMFNKSSAKADIFKIVELSKTANEILNKHEINFSTLTEVEMFKY